MAQSNSEMEVLLQDMDVGLCLDENDVSVVIDTVAHPRISLYKNRGRALDQERRWWRSLSALQSKANRVAKFDSNRRDFSSDAACICSEDKVHINRKHPWTSKPANYVGSSWRSFSKHLMLAEWLLFLPKTFFETYLLKLCPKGRHVLVKAEKGSTKIFSRTGRLLLRTVSHLPGGGLNQSDHQNSSYSTLLDCIMLSSENPENLKDPPADHDKEKNTVELKVLDLIHFRTTSYTCLTFRERCSWLEDYLRQLIEENSPGELLRFEIVPSHRCDVESMRAVFCEKPKFLLDGILFYHSEVIYEPGPTPLVGWLKPYMLPEWFPDIEPHADYLQDIPIDYTNYLSEIRHQETADSSHRRKPHLCPPVSPRN